MRRKHLRAILPVAVVAAGLGFGCTTAHADTSVTYNAISGTHTEQAHSNTNYCGTSTESVNSSTSVGKRAFNAFTTSVPSGNVITSATLQYYSHQTSSTNVNAFLQTTWTGFTSGCSIKWSNQPSEGTAIGASTAGQTNNAYNSVPLSDFSGIPTSGNIGFELNSQGTSDLGFDYDGTTHPPKLVITYAAVGAVAPVVSTGSASNVTNTGATLNGTVNPEGASTTYKFEYGTTTSYGTSVPVPDGSAGSGTSAVNESANISNLTASTTYHYRIDATNSAGTTNGSDATFTTSACGSAITISSGGTYSGCYQSTATGTPAVTINTTSAVTLSHAHIIAKGEGVVDNVSGITLTVQDSTFDQTDPGSTVNHRAMDLDASPTALTVTHNQFNQTDGIWMGGSAFTINTLSFTDNLFNDVGRYAHPTTSNCCVQAIQLDHVTAPSGVIQYNKMVTTSGTDLYDDGDQINLYFSGGSDSSHKFDISHNLVDGAYPASHTDTTYLGGGIMAADGGTGSFGHTTVHDNTVVSTTNYGVACAGGTDCHATNNVTVNDALGSDGTTTYYSDFGIANSFHDTTSSDATSGSYNWLRDNTSGQQACWMSSFCSGLTQVSTTEAQARTNWTNAIPSGELPIGPRP